MSSNPSGQQPLVPVMCLRPPNDILFDESFWDELKDAGITEIALQWLCLLDEPGSDDE